MDILLAVLIVFVAWLLFKSLVAVIVALIAVAIAVYLVRNSSRL